jgi:hypothetical protein
MIEGDKVVAVEKFGGVVNSERTVAVQLKQMR